MKVLGIETSCDETAVCLIEAEGGFGPNFEYKILGNALYSQTAVHAPYGGVFPNLAKREHAKNLVPLLMQALAAAEELHEGGTAVEIEKLRELLSREPELFEQLVPFLAKFKKPNVDAIAVTHGPGLEPALWVGINFAKALAHAWNLPLVPVNHMEGHVIISLMRNEDQIENRKNKMHKVEFPMLALLISGGHTELVLSKKWQGYELLGETRDDAVGEAFDKVARLLELPYPGGPHISMLAEHARRDGLPRGFELPRPMMHEDTLDFSLSGLKTAVRRLVETHRPLNEEARKQLAREFEDAVTDVLVHKTLLAIDEHGVRTLVVGGGVSANAHIRRSLQDAIENEGIPVKLLIPPPELATDNALMIALAGYFRAENGEYAEGDISANGNLKLAQKA